MIFSKRGFCMALAVAVAISFSGCAKDGMALNTMGGDRVDRVFTNGTVLMQQKVIIDDRETAMLTGAGIGGVAGAVAVGGNKVKGGLAGAAIGGIAGALIGNEIEAYKTTITGDDGQSYMGYLTQALPEGTRIEFTVVDGKLKNVNVLQTSRQQATRTNGNTRTYDAVDSQSYGNTTTRRW